MAPLQMLRKRLAGLGAGGRLPGNIARDMHRMIKRTHALELEPYEFTNVRMTSTGSVEEYQHAAILPHEAFAVMAEHSDGLELLLGPGGGDSLAEFWGHMHDEDWLLSHPVAGAIAAGPTKVIPVKLHGDDAKGFLMLSWASMQTRTCHRVLFGVLELSTCPGHMSEDHLWHIMRWSLESLGSGRFPARYHRGRPWEPGRRRDRAGQPLNRLGYRGAHATFASDWALPKELFKLSSHYNNTSCCHRCTTQKGGGPHSCSIVDRTSPGFQERRSDLEF